MAQVILQGDAAKLHQFLKETVARRRVLGLEVAPEPIVGPEPAEPAAEPEKPAKKPKKQAEE